MTLKKTVCTPKKKSLLTGLHGVYGAQKRDGAEQRSRQPAAAREQTAGKQLTGSLCVCVHACAHVRLCVCVCEKDLGTSSEAVK